MASPMWTPFNNANYKSFVDQTPKGFRLDTHIVKLQPTYGLILSDFQHKQRITTTAEFMKKRRNYEIHYIRTD